MVKIIKKKWRQSPIKNLPYSIIDVEINNNIDQGNGEWAYHKGHIVIFGIIINDEITQIIREPQDNDITYAKECWAYIQKAITKNKRPASFNWRMEYGCMNALFSTIHLRVGHVTEIKPFKAKGWSLGRFYNDLLRASPRKTPNVPDPLEFQSNKCIEHWNSNDPKLRELVIQHNISDMKREAIVLVNQKVFREGRNIDSSGWLVE